MDQRDNTYVLYFPYCVATVLLYGKYNAVKNNSFTKLAIAGLSYTTKFYTSIATIMMTLVYNLYSH